MRPEDTLAGLREVATSLRGRIESLDTDARGWALLWAGDELHPWTARAEEHWERIGEGPDDDIWHLHHLAVLRHAAAYDAESETGSEARAAAVRRWESALGTWSRLHGSDGFWAAMQEHLEAALDRPLPPGVLVGVVAAVRDRLPADLLAVHVALAAGRRADDPESAAAHVRLMIGSGLPARDVAAARQRLVADVDGSTVRAVEQVRFGAAFDEIGAWLTVDPTNPTLLRNLLFVADRWARFLLNSTGWGLSLDAMLERVRVHLHAAGTDRDRPDPEMAGELARHESWRAASLLSALPADLTRGGRPEALLAAVEVALTQLRRAVALDPSVRLERYYQVGEDLATALTHRAELRLMLGAAPADVEADVDEALGFEPEHPAALRVRERMARLRPEPTAAMMGGTLRACIRRGAAAEAVDALENLVGATSAADARRRLHDRAVPLRALVTRDPELRARYEAAMATLADRS